MGEISDTFANKIVNFYGMSPLGEMTSSISLFYELIAKAGLPDSLGPCPLSGFPPLGIKPCPQAAGRALKFTYKWSVVLKKSLKDISVHRAICKCI